MENSKSKKLIIAAVLFVILCIAGVTAFFAAPYIKNVTDPGRKAIASMKNAGAEVSDNVNSQIDSFIKSMTDGDVTSYEGYISYDEASYKQEKLSSYLKTSTIRYEYGIDYTNKGFGGSLSLADNENSDGAVTLQFYMDSNNVYFKVPELCSYNFKMSINDMVKYISSAEISNGQADIGFDMNDVAYALKFFKSVDVEEGNSYAQAAQSVVNDIRTGYEKAVEQFVYEKRADKKWYVKLSDDGTEVKEKATVYDVTITKQALLTGAEAAIDAVFDDDSISGYRTLITTYYKNSREKLKNAVREKLASYTDSTMTIYIGSDNRIINYEISRQGADVELESLKKGVLTQMAVKMTSDGMTYDMLNKMKDEDTYILSCSMSSADINIIYHGESKALKASDMRGKASDFTGAVDVTKLTGTQYQKIMMELLGKMQVLDKVISTDRLYNAGINGI